MHPTTCERNRSQYHGDRGTRGAWEQVLEPKLRGRGLGVSYNRSESGKSNERSTYSPRRILRSKEQPKVGDGQAMTVKPCQWNELDADSSAIDFNV